MGMSSTEIARSVPWSRLKPRKKYWLALPSPLCCVTDSPGAASRTSPGRVTGRALRSSPETDIWLARLGGPTGPVPTLGAPDEGVDCAGAAVAAGLRGCAGRDGGAAVVVAWCRSTAGRAVD